MGVTKGDGVKCGYNLSCAHRLTAVAKYDEKKASIKVNRWGKNNARSSSTMWTKSLATLVVGETLLQRDTLNLRR